MQSTCEDHFSLDFNPQVKQNLFLYKLFSKLQLYMYLSL